MCLRVSGLRWFRVALSPARNVVQDIRGRFRVCGCVYLFGCWLVWACSFVSLCFVVIRVFYVCVPATLATTTATRLPLFCCYEISLPLSCHVLTFQRASTALAISIDDETLEIGGLGPCTALPGDAAGGDQDEGGYGNVDFSSVEHGRADTRFPDGAQAVDDRRGREWHAVAAMEGHGEGEAGGEGADWGSGGGSGGEIARALNKLPQRMADLAELAAVEGADYEVQSRRREAWNAERWGGVTTVPSFYHFFG